jgi:hypothetical protein
MRSTSTSKLFFQTTSAYIKRTAGHFLQIERIYLDPFTQLCPDLLSNTDICPKPCTQNTH